MFIGALLLAKFVTGRSYLQSVIIDSLVTLSKIIKSRESAAHCHGKNGPGKNGPPRPKVVPVSRHDDN